eukprot:TRINITY_DN7642_c0_g1_i1.p1 TRINITY_DN7642_c0_g1~~TRINITY_DN7642_c0_g1_i1.p1  ORF type:complete len:206 (+),score=5.37 TRINITY_DN7642_c0_g1_i1:32-619(+)
MQKELHWSDEERINQEKEAKIFFFYRLDSLCGCDSKIGWCYVAQIEILSGQRYHKKSFLVVIWAGIFLCFFELIFQLQSPKKQIFKSLLSLKYFPVFYSNSLEYQQLLNNLIFKNQVGSRSSKFFQILNSGIAFNNTLRDQTFHLIFTQKLRIFLLVYFLRFSMISFSTKFMKRSIFSVQTNKNWNTLKFYFLTF